MLKNWQICLTLIVHFLLSSAGVPFSGTKKVWNVSAVHSFNAPLCFMSAGSQEWWVVTPPQRALGKSDISWGHPWTSGAHCAWCSCAFSFFLDWKKINVFLELQCLWSSRSVPGGNILYQTITRGSPLFPPMLYTV